MGTTCQSNGSAKIATVIDAQSLADQLTHRGYRRTPEMEGTSPTQTLTRGDFRWEWFATYLRLTVLIRSVETASRADVEQFAAQSTSLATKRFRFRGLQAGVATIPVLLCDQVDADAVAAACAVPSRRFAAMTWPVVVDLSQRQIHYYSGDLVLGVVYQDWILTQIAVIKNLAEQTVGDALADPSPKHSPAARSAPGRTMARAAGIAILVGAGLVLVSLVILFVLNR